MSSRRRDRFTGILVVDKPKGPTSARVVAAIKKRLDIPRVGHTGTLDPMATGVLPLCLGPATKLASFLLADDKEYTGQITLGQTTNTLDAEGETTGGDREAAAAVTEESVRAAMKALTGEIEQVPPMFSALRSGGRRLYDLARQGKSIERPPRAVTIARFELTGFQSPVASFVVSCTKGTYVRSLARDVGEALGCGAHLSALRRTRSGAFGIDSALELEQVDPATVGNHLIGLLEAVSQFPRIPVPPSRLRHVSDGLQLRWEQLEADQEAPAGRMALVGGEDGRPRLLAVAQVEGGVLVYDRVFKTQS